MGIVYGIAETRGYRGNMEDSHAIWDQAGQPFSAEVYDGHGGSLAATLAAEILTPCFFSMDNQGKARTFTAEDLREAYLATDRYIASKTTDSGTAAATLHIRENRFLAANAGDVRIVIGNGNGFKELTLDHKPDLPEEKARIEALGGRVILVDVARVQGSLSMSRALGDVVMKPYVTPEPRITEGFLGKANDIAVIACDGVWTVMSSEEAIAIARSESNPETAAEKLKSSALERGSTDNITVIVLDLKPHTARCELDQIQIIRVLDKAVSLEIDRLEH